MYYTVAEYMEDVTHAIDNGNDVDVIYLDFCFRAGAVLNLYQ